MGKSIGNAVAGRLRPLMEEGRWWDSSLGQEKSEVMLERVKFNLGWAEREAVTPDHHK